MYRNPVYFFKINEEYCIFLEPWPFWIDMPLIIWGWCEMIALPLKRHTELKHRNSVLYFALVVFWLFIKISYFASLGPNQTVCHSMYHLNTFQWSGNQRSILIKHTEISLTISQLLLRMPLLLTVLIAMPILYRSYDIMNCMET